MPQYAQSGGCAAMDRGCAACIRQAMENEKSDIPAVRRAANKAVHCKCFDKNCANAKAFIDVCKANKINPFKYK
eukprot:scaffold85546_cov16-Prasinocladus_malaysianus.AAC.1